VNKPEAISYPVAMKKNAIRSSIVRPIPSIARFRRVPSQTNKTGINGARVQNNIQPSGSIDRFGAKKRKNITPNNKEAIRLAIANRERGFFIEYDLA
jgi:hypothetical protein